MFGFGKKKGGGGRKGKDDEEAEVEGMMMDPAEMMRGLENDPELMRELRALGGLTHENEDEPVQGKAQKPSAKAAAKPSAADAFLANLDMSALEDAEGLGLIDDDNIKLDDHDLNDTGLLAELGDLGWEEGEEDPEAHEGGGAAGEVDHEVLSPSLTPSPAEPSNTDHIKEVEAKMAECKARAVALKNEGKIEEAVAEVKKLRQLETELGVRTTLGVVSDVAKAVPTRPPHDSEDTEVEDDEKAAGVATTGGAAVGSPPRGARAPSAVAGGTAGAAPSPPAPTVAQQRLEQLKTEADAKRKAALQMRKEGHLEEALSFMREAKALDAELARLMKRSSSRNLLRQSSSEEGVKGPGSPLRPTVAAPVTRPTTMRDAFTPLEEALNEAIQMTKKAAIALKDADKKAAVEELKKAKEYASQLEVLKAKRATPGAAPAPFEWQVTGRKFQKVLQDVPADSLELTIKEGKELYGTRRDKAPVKDKIFIAYDMGYPKDKPHTGHTPTVHTNHDASATFDFNTQVPLQRSKAELMAFTRRSVTLQVMRKKGLIIKSEELMTEARIELAHLLDHCELHLEAPLLKEGTRRPCGGHLKVSLRVREPLKEHEFVEEQTRTLLLGPWPPVSSMPIQQPTSVASPRPPEPPAAEPKPATPKPAVLEAEDERFKVLTPLEKAQPLSPECIVSNDVFEYELQLLTSNPDKLDENDLAIRQAQLNMRMNILVLKVQREELSLDQYTAMIKERIERDRLLARFLTKEGRKAEAVRVLKRTKIMEQELASASEGAEEG